ncbi:hypothetical protein [Streptosporangium sp. NPDC051022]|uniref:hypothetical protein n=1 Tax=Streptosporangium sp. NPDC051022 TaxID=3155752 RepID=UPI0034143B8A
MSGDLVSLAHEVSPYVTAAVSAYGAAVLARAQEDAADATVGWGRRILQRIFGIQAEEDAVPDEVAELADDPDNTDLQAALRVQIRKLLAADPQLAAEVAQMVEQARNQVAVGQGQVNAQASGNAQQANLGQGTMNVSFGAQRDRSADR